MGQVRDLQMCTMFAPANIENVEGPADIQDGRPDSQL